MKTFELMNAKYLGKVYRGCVLTLDEASGQAEVVHRPRKLFGSKTASLAKFTVDAKTTVSRQGNLLTLGDLELLAPSPAETASLLAVLEAPRKSARETAEKALALAEERAVGFLRARADSLAFLARLRRDPAETLLSLTTGGQVAAEAALKEQLKSQSDTLAAALDGLDSALADLEAKSSSQVSERVYAVTYVAGTMQNHMFDKGQPGLESEPFLGELGIRADDVAPPFENLPARIVASAHASTAALLG